MCQCKNVSIGSYDRQVSMKDPFNSRKRHDGWVCIDVCICQQIAELWYQGIKTVESCCGHNINQGYIMVYKEDFDKMIKLGYKENKEWNSKNYKSELRVFNN
jgi:hypothetical protein